MRMALAYTLERGYEGVVVMDGNNKDDPAAVPAFLQLLTVGYDHIQGSRYVPGGKAIHTPWSRHLALKCLHAPLLSLAAGFRYTDTTNGFRAYSRRLLLDERVAPFRDVFSGYELHYYLAIRAARLRFHVCETPVTRSLSTRANADKNPRHARQPTGPADAVEGVPPSLRSARNVPPTFAACGLASPILPCEKERR